MNLNLFFETLVIKLQLGKMLTEGVRLRGGLMHLIYKLTTDKGIFVVKLLNPNIMKRPTAMKNFLEAQKLECILHQNNIPIIPYLIFEGNKMQEIDGQYFYVFHWYQGKSLKGHEITKFHCQKMSSILSLIHKIEVRKEKYAPDKIHIDWKKYIFLAREQNLFIGDLLESHEHLLYESQNKGNIAVENIPSIVSICHNDMDCKNVLWIEDECKVIDLETLSYSNPYLEMYELALCWSGYEECNVDFELFKIFIDTYFKFQPRINIDWESIYYSNYGRISWLEYNVKRALMIECDSLEEQQLGIEQVKETMKHVIYYKSIKEKILKCLT